jgi:hypothetical protein
MSVAVRTELDELPPVRSHPEQPVKALESTATIALPSLPPAQVVQPQASPQPAAPAKPTFRHGWPVPSTISDQPDQARACIVLPTFHPEALEQARVISDCFPEAESEFRNLRSKGLATEELEIPHFERVFRIAARLAGLPGVEQRQNYDELLILSAWQCVRP